MSSERFNGVKIEQWDRASEDVVRNIHDGLLQRRDALNFDIERVAGHMVLRGWMTAEEAYSELDTPTPLSYAPARLGDPEE